jgi:eukaryotic-like serine/threonine-protein kinase
VLPQAEEIVADKYRLVRHLARGGMGAVWRARHLELDVDVALKFLRSDTPIDERADARFRREARAAAQLKSRHVVHIYDFGSHQGISYLAMELLDGLDLEQFLGQGGRLPIAEALTILDGAGQGLKAVHRAGLIHRDIKPSNFFVANEGGESVIKLLDFGIAKQLHLDRSRGSHAETTAAGEVFGSPAYMSPEQARGGAVGTASDLWSLAAVFYRMLTGQSPFQGESSGDVVVKACTEDPPPASSFSDELTAEVDDFFRRALSRDPLQRFSEVDALLEAAFSLTSDAPERARLSAPFVTHGEVGRSTETAPLPIAGATLRDSQPPVKPRDFKRIFLVGLVLLSGVAASLAFILSAAPEPEGLTSVDQTGEFPSKPPGELADGSGKVESKPELRSKKEMGEATSKLPTPPEPLAGTAPQGSAKSKGPSPKPVDASPRDSSKSGGPDAISVPAQLPRPAATPTDPIFGLPVDSP